MDSHKCSDCSAAPPFSLSDILQQEALTPCFQPIVSLNRKLVCGLEGLIRGIDPETGGQILPQELFSAAQEAGLSLALDRLCRKKILQAFRGIHRQNREKLLFLNIDASVLEQTSGSNYLFRQVEEAQVPPGNVVIEISETKVHGSVALKRFADTYRQYGFLIAMDDVGTGFSNLDRILLVKPDIIKIDISLVRKIDQDFYKQGIFRSLVNLSAKIGALVVAEGVETREEAIAVLRMGCHMIQGFFFSPPKEAFDEALSRSDGKIDTLIWSFSLYMNQKCREENLETLQLQKISRHCVNCLKAVPCAQFHHKLMEIIRRNPTAECLYLLDERGIQVSETVSVPPEITGPNHLIFYSTRVGADHSMDNYYYPLIYAKRREYITEPYISLATGNLCITVSSIFRNVEGRKFILCMDFRTTEEKIETNQPSGSCIGPIHPDIGSLVLSPDEKTGADAPAGSARSKTIA